MGRMTRRVGPALLTLAVVLAGAPVADARPITEDGPSQVRGFPITVDTTVPAGGRAWVGSPSLPTRARTIELSIEAAGGVDTFAALYTALAGMTNKNRLLFCSAIGLGLSWNSALPSLALVGAADPMQACFGIVALMTGGGRSGGTQLRSRCPQTVIAVPVATTSAGIVPTGPAARPRRPALRLRCTLTTTGMKLRVSTRSRTASLRSIVGERLTIGFASAPGATSDTALTLTYGKPR